MGERSQIEFHQKWIGYLNPTGLVFSPQAIEDAQAVINESVVPEQKNFASLVAYEVDDKFKFKGFDNCLQIFKEVLNWRDSDLVSDPEKISEFTFRHPQFDELVSPTYVSLVDKVPKILIQAYDDTTDFDKNTNTQDNWNSSIHFKFERLLREKQIATGILVSKEKFRLIYAPRGETSGFIDFKFEIMHQPSGRIIFAAFKELFSDTRVFNSPKGQSLIEILETSRDYQSKVSIALSGQVLEALYELLRGFQAAYDEDKRDLITKVQKENPQLIYEGLLTVLLRMVFTMYSEDRELLATDEVYQTSYSLAGLYDRLRLDAAQNPDTMDHRYGAWAHLISLFRLVYDGAEYSSNKGVVRLPARHGHLFDPNVYLFLEGRYKNEDPYETSPKVSDGVIFRILTKLLYLNGERINYRTLDVEQIGSVYETMMGFELDLAKGPTIAIVPVKSHGAPVPVNLEEILDSKSPSKVLAETTDIKLSDKIKKEFDAAKTVEDLEKVLDAAKKIDRRATLYTLSKGAMVLRPSEARRKSGSHYTPRELTEPIVKTALRPIFERLSSNPMPEQILDLKICDPAMGSGAFLVEVCRQLSEKLVEAWAFHKVKVDLPSDEDHLMFAKRMVAQKCLYGVDKNHMAVNLAKLSLWLVTLAKDHAFSFLDHNFKSGDSLVGLTNKQILSFDYTDRSDLPLFQHFKHKLNDVIESREEIRNASEEKNYDALKIVEEANRDEIEPLRLVGDLIVKCFFDGKTDKERDINIQQHQITILNYLSSNSFESLVKYCRKNIEKFSKSVTPFHWELEFPEVFMKGLGFDCFIGNPPFLGAKKIKKHFGEQYISWLKGYYSNSLQQTDLVCYFFQRIFNLMSKTGTATLISTNSISQGDCRPPSLGYICHAGGVIYSCIKRKKWPGIAVVNVSIISFSKADLRIPPEINGIVVDFISPYLVPFRILDEPKSLSSNLDKTCKGPNIYGEGFVFQNNSERSESLDVYEKIQKKNKKITDVVFDFITAEEILGSPVPLPISKVIDVNDYSIERVMKEFPEIYQVLLERVKPKRDELPNTKDNKKYKELWWNWARPNRKLKELRKKHDEFLVHPFTTSNLAFTKINSSIILPNPHVVIFNSSYEMFGILQSSIHETWVRLFASSLKDDLRYTPSDCFETFPFPDIVESVPLLRASGKEYFEYRNELMKSNNEGLTKTYNKFHNPEECFESIQKLRNLQMKLDEVVFKAYGWNDLVAKYDFYLDFEDDDDDEDTNSKRKKPFRYKFAPELHDEVLARLLNLNKEMYESEIVHIAKKKK